ncbi:MAG: hypothetical protein II843_04430, partial [Alphaproteobacteria bacterium]|nr:hypothetical protein [Alphaproteobacteria bacterium]
SILISAPTFATGVSSGVTSADCDNATLDTYTGTSNLQAGWQPNTIALHWYNGDTEITSGVQTSCVYDGTLTPPTTIPTKTGYTFKGWRVRQTPCSFANQVCGLTGSQVTSLTFNSQTGNPNEGYKNDSNITYDPSGYYGSYEHNGSKYGLTEDYTWAVEFTNGGVARGIASCNGTAGNPVDSLMEGIMNGTISMDTEEEMQFYMETVSSAYGSCNSGVFKPNGAFTRGTTGGPKCWCKMTSWTPSGGSACNTASSRWVYIADADMNAWYTGCAGMCAEYCASIFAENESAFLYRRAIWGVAQ